MQNNLTISTFELFERFPDADSARLYFEEQRWNGKVVCPHCTSERISVRTGKRTGYFRCGICKAEFTVRTGTIFERSHVPLHKWLYAMYLTVTARKGISSLQLSKQIGVTQKTAWFMLQRLREACGNDNDLLTGVIEVDETYVGGLEKNKHWDKKQNAGRGTVGKQAVFGMRERKGKIKAMPVSNTTKTELQGKIHENVKTGSTIYSDESTSYEGLNGLFYKHGSVNHSAKQYVDGMAHVNGIESVWAVIKRSYKGVYHHWTMKHCHRYINEFTFRLNEANCKVHTLERLDKFLEKSFNCRITYEEVIS